MKGVTLHMIHCTDVRKIKFIYMQVNSAQI